MNITSIEESRETDSNIPIDMNHINISDTATETLRLVTGPENDHITVNYVTGNIYIDTGAGNDQIHIYDVYGDLEIHAGSGNDKVFIYTPTAGCTVVYGGSGEDKIVGGPSSENLYGGSGDDKIVGGGDADVLEGGPNNGYYIQDFEGSIYIFNGDHLWGGYADLYSYDGESNTFVFRNGDGVQTIHDFQLWLDTLEIHGYSEEAASFFYDSENSFIALNDTEGILLLNTEIDPSDIDWVTPELHSHSLYPDPIMEWADATQQSIDVEGKIWAHERDSGDPRANDNLQIVQVGDPILFVDGYPLFMTHPDVALILSDPNALSFTELSVCEKSIKVSYEYSIDSVNLEFLEEGSELTVNYFLSAVDAMAYSLPKGLTITIIGVNDVPTITGDFTGSVTVDTTPGSVTQVSGALIINDPDDGESSFQLPAVCFDSPNEYTYTLMTVTSFDTATMIFDNNTDIFKENIMANVISRTDSGDDSVDVAGTYGSFNFSTDGTWVYTLDDSPGSAAIQLPGGTTADDTLTVTSFDGTAWATIDVTVTGTNSVPTIGGVNTGAVTVDTNPNDVVSTSGSLTIDDPNTGESSFQVPDNLVGTYGSFTFDTAGDWTYTLDDSAGSAAIQLNGGTTADDTLTVTSFDGSATATIDVTVTGTNSVPTFGGTNTGDVTVDPNNGFVETFGQVTIDDPNTGESFFQMPDNLNGNYGTFYFDNYYGYWTYVLDDSPGSASIQLPAGTVVDDMLSLTSYDGSASTAIDVTITGANSVPTIGGVNTGAVTVDTNPDDVVSTSGSLTIDDPNTGESSFQVPDNLVGTYGSFTFDTAGDWTYTLDDSAGSAAIQLPGGTTADDTLTVTSFDGSATATIDVTVTGTNSVPTLGGTNTGAVTVDPNNGYVEAFGQVTIADPNTGESLFQVPASLDGTYGSFSFDNYYGYWNYVLDDSVGSASIQLPGGTVVDDMLTVTSFDGTASTTIDVTITGANSVPTIGGVNTGAVTVDTNPDDVVSTSGSLTISDPNTGESSFQVPANLVGTYGTFTFDSAGDWTYTLDDSAGSAAIQLPGGTTADDTLTVTSFDGSATATIDVTVTGTNSVPTIGGSSTGAVAVDTTGAPVVTSGALTIDDPNTGESSFQLPAIMLNEVFCDQDAPQPAHFHHIHAMELASPLCVFDFANHAAMI